MEIHIWTYEENKYCVEQAFEYFVIKKEYDYMSVINKLYLHFDGVVKKSSLKMKLQNIKYLFNKYKVPNTLCLKELGHVSKKNERAFFTVHNKYSKMKI